MSTPRPSHPHADGISGSGIDASTGIEYLARAGYAAKGIVYGTIGVLATMTAGGFSDGRLVGTSSAIQTLRAQPFGQIVGWCMVVGLVGYVIWRFVQAGLDPENKGSDLKGILARAGLAISGGSYATLAWFTAAGLLSGTSSGDDNGARESTATLLQQPFGAWLVGLVAAIFVGIGCYQFWRAYTLQFTKDWKSGQMDPWTRPWATRLSRFGIMARAVSFGLIGWFFLQAARWADASEVEGLSGALQSFAGGEYGHYWLAAIGLGFVCYGIYCVVNARFRRINPGA